MDESNTDINKIKYILGSINIILKWTASMNESQFEKDILVNDAVCNRFKCIIRVFSEISMETKSKLDGIFWSGLTGLNFFKEDLYAGEDVWMCISGSEEELGSLRYIYKTLEDNYILNKKENRIKIETISSFDKYPVKTSKSIWTVKKK